MENTKSMNTKNSKLVTRKSDVGNRTIYGSVKENVIPESDPPAKKTDNLSIRILFRTTGTATALMNPVGVVVRSNVKLLHLAFDKCLDQKKDTIILNMSSVDSIDRYGWKCIFDTQKHLKHERVELFLCCLKSDMVADAAFYGARYNDSVTTLRTIPECQKAIESTDVHQKIRTDPQDQMSTSRIDQIRVGGTNKKKTVSLQTKSTDTSGYPVREKISKIISRYGPSSIFEILTRLRSNEYNNTRISLLELYMLLKEMDLNSWKKRERLYRAS